MRDPRNDSTSHPIEPSMVSAWYDNLLSPDERRIVERHLATCPDCRERLDSYVALGRELRTDLAESVPEALDRRLASLLQGAQSDWSRLPDIAAQAPSPWGSPWLRPFRSAFAATILVSVLTALLLFGLPFGGQLGSPPTATAYPCDETTDCDVRIEFNGAIDRASVEQTIWIEPQVRFTTRWNDDTLLIKLEEPSPPTKSYTVRLHPRKVVTSSQIQANAATPTPFELYVAAPPVGTPPAVLAAGSLSPISAPVAVLPPTPTQEMTMAAVARTATHEPSPSETVTPCAVVPILGFGPFQRNQPEVAVRLGCAVGAEAGVEIVMQEFEHGQLIWRSDHREIVGLFLDGRWRRYPIPADANASATDTPATPATSATAIPAAPTTSVTVTPATPTASATDTTGTPTDPTDSATASPMPTATPQLVLRFDRLLRAQPELRNELGNPSTPEHALKGAVASFQNGILIWSEGRTIYALYADGAWERHHDSFRDQTTTPFPAGTTTPVPSTTVTETEKSESPTPTVTPITGTPTPSASDTPTTDTSGTPTPASSAVPSVKPSGTLPTIPTVSDCAIQPAHELAVVFPGYPMVAMRVGCAREPEQGTQLVWQAFEQGLVVWHPDQRTIFAIRDDRTWSVYLDTWQAGESLNGVVTPPASNVAPGRAIGKLWYQNPDFRTAIGWPTSSEATRESVLQEFTGGWMVWSEDRVTYVLYADGTWERLDDPFVDLTPTAEKVP